MRLRFPIAIFGPLKLKTFLIAICIAVRLPVSVGKSAEETSGSQNVVISQIDIGNNACAPCAIYNSLANGSPECRAVCLKLVGDRPEDRIRNLISSYGLKPSESYSATRLRYTDENGMSADDQLLFFNEILSDSGLPNAAASYLDRKKDEPSSSHLRRVHSMFVESLDAGMPPIVEFRSFAARPPGLVEKLRGGGHKWHGLAGHSVALVEIQPELRDDDSGFWCRYADSASGQVESAFVHVEQVRDFVATKQFTVTDKGEEVWDWVSDYPYLLITAPTQLLNTQVEPGHVRTIITLRHAIVRKPE